MWVRLGNAARRLNAITGAARSFVYWWPQGNPNLVRITGCENASINLTKIIGDGFLEKNMIQVFVNDSGENLLQDAVKRNAWE